jgi:DNA invertase Pin-like site-specific DNA recombinase
MVPEGMINARDKGSKISSKKSGYISNAFDSKKNNKTEKLEINTVRETFNKFSLDMFINSITIAASTKSNITNNRSSLTLHSSIKKMNTASRIAVIISQNTQLFNQLLIFSIAYSLINKNDSYILIVIIKELSILKLT